jgi:hypothetical protein
MYSYFSDNLKKLIKSYIDLNDKSLITKETAIDDLEFIRDICLSEANNIKLYFRC